MRARHLGPQDLAAAYALSSAAGWNQTPEDWKRMLALEPRGCFGVDCDGQLVATATLLCYGTSLAWLGMVLTDAAYQRRGFGRAVVEFALEEARLRGVRCVMLDATDQGRPLYRSAGFEDEQWMERWQCSAPALPAAPVPQGTIGTGPIPLDLDREAFGVDRSRVLRALCEEAPPIVSDRAYVLRRAGFRAHYLGPCVAPDPKTARGLIAACLGTHLGEPWFWDLIVGNRAATDIAAEFGFSPVRRLTRMFLGEPPRRNDSITFAIAGFEAG